MNDDEFGILMTTPKPTPKKKPKPPETIAYKKPSIGAHVYVTVGESGWTETFDREVADKALVDLLAPLDVDDILVGFAMLCAEESREETWGDVMTYLAKMTQKSPRALPEIAGVALWGKFALYEQADGAN